MGSLYFFEPPISFSSILKGQNAVLQFFLVHGVFVKFYPVHPRKLVWVVEYFYFFAKQALPTLFTPEFCIAVDRANLRYTECATNVVDVVGFVDLLINVSPDTKQNAFRLFSLMFASNEVKLECERRFQFSGHDPFALKALCIGAIDVQHKIIQNRCSHDWGSSGVGLKDQTPREYLTSIWSREF